MSQLAGPGARNATAVVGLVCGVATVVAVWVPGVALATPMLGIAAVALGLLGRAKAPREGGRLAATVALVLGAVGLVLFAVLLTLGFVLAG